jgi:hypothetical protein
MYTSTGYGAPSFVLRTTAWQASKPRPPFPVAQGSDWRARLRRAALKAVANHRRANIFAERGRHCC